MRKTLSRILTILIVAISLACSGTTPPAPNPSYIKELEQSFANNPSDADKIRIAIELVRQGARSPKYRIFLLDEADEALAAEEQAAEQWKREAGLVPVRPAADPPARQVRSSRHGTRWFVSCRNASRTLRICCPSSACR
jgi:hypothetical protein